jgi:hypothetical protein
VQVADCRLRTIIGATRGTNYTQGFTEPLVDGTEFAAPGDKPGLFALSHGRAKGTTSTSPWSFGSAPPCLTRTATGTRR